ncbi:hypothetical protein BDM02DRAFT_3189531 [Thelephora ganbajun]|uniref:Uncharacterized protein n=1 Tax=Thelephora ganbajun TaxID=370292 RepID=A0ACB6Z7T5_THEGA|nr:hypothetical protein BDM02DRAFT_3189531 [Thelephora ganbajun]
MASIIAESLIPIGNDVMAFGYYTMATQIVYYYDYFLTLPDEIKYAWPGRKTWSESVRRLALSVLTRPVFLVFILIYSGSLSDLAVLQFASSLFLVTRHSSFNILQPGSCRNTRIECNKTAFLEILSFFLCTLFAQVSLITRLYAVTLKKKRIAVFFSAITIAQSIVGMYTIVITARKQSQEIPGIPLQAYDPCVFTRSPHLELAYMSLSLFFDAMVFSVIVYVSLRTGLSLPGGQPSILRTIFEDSTVYFLVIFSSHLLSLIVLLATRPSLQLLPSLGNNVYGRTFILRLSPVLTMSASRGEKSGWTSDALSRTHARTVPQIEFGHPSDGPEDGVGTTFDEMALSDLSGGQVREDNDEDAV